ncbi:MAG: hypothetical protein J5J06_08330 [Phycisphaerae bacterium]|nr:hypothetical protein [Phycisphaerae bacterium]
MADAPPATRPMLGLLLRVRTRCVRNRILQAVDEAPMRLSLSVVMIAVIWVGLYGMFWGVFRELRHTPLEATVAFPLIFNFFFVAMLILLTLSNAVIVYSALFSKSESAYLLSAPLEPLDVVTLKYLESLVLASWALVLLGIPLMLALARQTDNPLFYVLFLVFFIAFIPIPASLGLLLAWLTAEYFPRRVSQGLFVGVGVVAALLVLAGIRSMQLGNEEIEVWLRDFQSRMAILQSAFMPNYWVAAGIDEAMHERFENALLYLGVTAANALFLSWIAVRVVSGRLFHALDRAVAAGGSRRQAVRSSGGLAGRLFSYLPLPLRLIAAKDLRTFFRDPLQWSQLAILFGLLALYLSNMPTLRANLSGYGWYLAIPYLNLCAVTLILATFTCRFVFPLVSLEGQTLWLVGLLPMPRGSVLRAKFAFAMTVTMSVGLAALIPAIIVLGMQRTWALMHFGLIITMCYGLCGVSVGLGARLPQFRETNPARIANGLGGTINLMVSLVLATGVLVMAGWATYRAGNLAEDAPPDRISALLCLAGMVLAYAVGRGAMSLGRRHFERVEV